MDDEKKGPTERELDKASSRGNKSFRVLQGEQKWQPRKTKKKKKRERKKETSPVTFFQRSPVRTG